MLNHDAFEELLQNVTLAWNQGDFSGAVAQLDSHIPDLSQEMKCNCLLFRGMIKQDQGFMDEAKRDWLDAIPLSQEGTFLRYSLQVNLGKLAETAGEVEAINWFSLAIKTCSQGEGFVGTKALVAFLAINDYQIPPEDRSDVAEVIEKAWEILGLSEVPNLDDLPASILKLNTQSVDRMNQIINEV